MKWKKGKWNKYLAGHHVRLNNPRKKGSIPWNKGKGTGKKFKYEWLWDDKKGKQVRAHRFIMEEILGRPLREEEVVHHIDEETWNNNPENLWLFHCDACHQYFHRGASPLAYEYPPAHRTKSKRTPMT